MSNNVHSLRASIAPPQRKIRGAPVPNDRGQDGFSSNQLHSLTKVLLNDILYSLLKINLFILTGLRGTQSRAGVTRISDNPRVIQ